MQRLPLSVPDRKMSGGYVSESCLCALKLKGADVHSVGLRLSCSSIEVVQVVPAKRI
jgi:hypothetical protein